MKENEPNKEEGKDQLIKENNDPNKVDSQNIDNEKENNKEVNIDENKENNKGDSIKESNSEKIENKNNVENNKDIKDDNIDNSENKNNLENNKDDIKEELKKEKKEPEKKDNKKDNAPKKEADKELTKETKKKINDIISLIEKILGKYSSDLESYALNYSLKIKKFISDINAYKDDLLNKSNLLEKPINKENNKDKRLSVDEFIQLMERIMEVFVQIFNTVEKTLEITFKFLEISKDINKKNLIDAFLLNEFENISNCWLFKQINFKNFDLNKALDKYNLQPNFKKYISQEYEKKVFVLNIANPKGEIIDQKEQKLLKEIKEKNIKSLEENKNNIIKLRMENAGSVEIYLAQNEYNKLKKFYVENTKMQHNNIFKKMPNLEKLTLRSIPNLQIDVLEFLPSKLKQLILEKNNFVNYDLENIFKSFLSNNNNILSNLEYLSFSKNNITRADLCVISPKVVFKGLREMNFYKNNIYKLILNPENFPNLKFINCCKNNLNKSFLTQLKNIGSLESENGFLLDPEICRKYYTNLKSKLITNEKDLYRTKYLNLSYMPKVQTLKYFDEFAINEQIRVHLRKLDLSNNDLDCDTFFKFLEQNKAFEKLKTLNLSGNELDDTFFEKLLTFNAFTKLQHLYLNSNKIGDTNVLVKYKDDIPIDPKFYDKNIIYKLRLLYKFIQTNTCLTKLTITKNPIAEFYSITQEKNNNADKSDKYIKRDSKNKIIINCLFSLLIKIRDELLKGENENKRNKFNLRFDCRSNVNKNSENYPYGDKPIIYKKNN